MALSWAAEGVGRAQRPRSMRLLVPRVLINRDDWSTGRKEMADAYIQAVGLGEVFWPRARI